MQPTRPRPSLKLVRDLEEQAWASFCGRCAAAPQPAPAAQATGAPAPRVCAACGLGLVLQAPAELVPDANQPFLVVDAALTVQAMSQQAERLLGLDEGLAVNRRVTEILVPADAEAGSDRLVEQLVLALSGSDAASVHVRPWNTFGLRMRATVAPCGPPRAALLVLDRY